MDKNKKNEEKKSNKIINYLFNNKRKKITIILIAIVIVAIIGGWLWLVLLHGYITVDDAYIDRDKATISSKILARISNILVNEGDIVRKDQLLIQLENTELLAQKKQAEANLDFAKINFEKKV